MAAISMKSQEDSEVIGSETQVFSVNQNSCSCGTEIKLKTTFLTEFLLELTRFPTSSSPKVVKCA